MTIPHLHLATERERERERESAVWTLESPFVVQLFVSHHWLNMQDHSFFFLANKHAFVFKQTINVLCFLFTPKVFSASFDTRSVVKN